MRLWEKGIVENVYDNQKGKFSGNEPRSLSAFSIKAPGEAAAHQALDTTDIVKSNLATYSLRPIGETAFGRNDKATKMAATDGYAFAVLWALQTERTKNRHYSFERTGQCGVKLMQEGVIENGYIDPTLTSMNIEGKQPAIFFINAPSEKAARKILDKMSLVKEKQATYGLHDVGQFFLGRKK